LARTAKRYVSQINPFRWFRTWIQGARHPSSEQG
jgi:hypothetical protein